MCSGDLNDKDIELLGCGRYVGTTASCRAVFPAGTQLSALSVSHLKSPCDGKTARQKSRKGGVHWTEHVYMRCRLQTIEHNVLSWKCRTSVEICCLHLYPTL